MTCVEKLNKKENIHSLRKFAFLKEKRRGFFSVGGFQDIFFHWVKK